MKDITRKAASKLMKDVGHKSEESTPASPPKNEKYYPTCCLTSKELPMLKGKKVDDVFVVKVEFRVAGTNQHNDKPVSYDLEIKKIGGGE